MPAVLRRIIILLAAFAIAAPLHTPAHAQGCSCASHTTPSDPNGPSLIFLGKLEQIQASSPPFSLSLDFRVQAAIYGQAEGTQTVYVRAVPGCEVVLQIGVSYNVAAKRGDDVLELDSCSPVRPAASTGLTYAELGRYAIPGSPMIVAPQTVPREGSDDAPTPAVALVLLLSAVASLGVIAVGRRT